MATIIGLAQCIGKSFIEDEGVKVFFFDWMLLATPISAVMLFVGWLLLTSVIFPLKIEGLMKQQSHLNKCMRHLAKYLPMNEEFLYICDDSL